MCQRVVVVALVVAMPVPLIGVAGRVEVTADRIQPVADVDAAALHLQERRVVHRRFQLAVSTGLSPFSTVDAISGRVIVAAFGE